MNLSEQLLENLGSIAEASGMKDAVDYFKTIFHRLGDGNKAMKAAINVAVDSGMDADEAFTELASLKEIKDFLDLQDVKGKAWDEKEVKRFIQKRFS